MTTNNKNKRRDPGKLLFRAVLVAGGLYLMLLPEAVERIDEPWRTEGMVHTEKCTYLDYWTRHYDECVPEGSGIYRRPEASDVDDSSFLFDESAVLYAALN